MSKFEPEQLHPIPGRAPDLVHSIAAADNRALIYRLSGGLNNGLLEYA